MEQAGKSLEMIQKRLNDLRATMTNTPTSSNEYKCRTCKDSGYIVDGWTAQECQCLAQTKLTSRVKNAMIPEEFKDARFDTYKAENDTQKLMLDSIKGYLKSFEHIWKTSENSFGFMAQFGELRFREIKDHAKRGQAKKLHNNFGLGKTHLQVAAAKWLIKQGYSVLIISDVTFMDDLSRARSISDEGEEFNKLLGAANQVDVLVWDDIGKAKTTEFRLNMYYQIINERYKNQKPILYSSNEDMDTLTEKIGDAAASRLFGMSKGRIFAVEGPDYRLGGEKVG
jgi:DNA replication protein DnaC